MHLDFLVDATLPDYESISEGCAGFSEDDGGLAIFLLEYIVVSFDVFALWTDVMSIGIASVHANTDTTSCVRVPNT